MQVKLIEYKFTDGQWNVKDSVVKDLASHMDLKTETFYNVDVSNFNVVPYFKSCRTFFAEIPELPDEQLAGMVWLSSWNTLNKSGFFNFTTFDFCPLTPAQKATSVRTALIELFDKYGVKTLYGETSVCRVAVIAFAQWLGFKMLGQVSEGHWHHDEQKWYDTVMMYINGKIVRR